MGRLMAVALLAVAAFLVLRDRVAPKQEAVAPPPPPALEIPAPRPVFSEAELNKVRASLRDTDPEVRWSAAQLLYEIRDPQAMALLDRMLHEDTDPQLRMKVLGLLKGREDAARLTTLVASLRDSEKSVRIAALDALGVIGDPSVTTWVTALLRDTEPEVRIAALRTLGKFQEKRKREFQALADKLRKDYEAAVRRAQLRR